MNAFMRASRSVVIHWGYSESFKTAYTHSICLRDDDHFSAFAGCGSISDAWQQSQLSSSSWSRGFRRSQIGFVGAT